MKVQLPISKSIAQRELVMRAMRGDNLRPLLAADDVQSWPADVLTMLHGLIGENRRIDVGNDGTAMRFLTAYYAQKEGADIILDGCQRMRERPIRQLVEALRELGAEIRYMGEEGFAPLHIRGKLLEKKHVVLNDPESTQFVSALMLIGVDVATNRKSPYIEMTKSLLASFSARACAPKLQARELDVERDWSAAAFWLERKALGLINEVTFEGLFHNSLQGDKVCCEIFETIEELKTLQAQGGSTPPCFAYDFSACPDLYPAVAVTCHELGIATHFTGLESLRLKESNRLAAMEEGFSLLDARPTGASSPHALMPTHHDHRIAMAWLAAGYDVDDEPCCQKSYPDFVLQLRGITRVVPKRGVNDDGKGKKWALHKLVQAAETEWVWLADDDVTFPKAVPSKAALDAADMIILPLQMLPAHRPLQNSSLLDDLQMLEYAAIQALTMRKAEQGRAVMCSGANLLVRRQVWLDCESELHPEIPSGDDMFLLEAVKRRGLRIRTLPASFAATCYAEPTLQGLLRQRMRWAGKAPHYSDKDILRTGAWTVATNVLSALCPIWLLGKWVVDMHLIRQYTQQKRTAKFCLETLLLTILYPWYMLICLIGGKYRTTW